MEFIKGENMGQIILLPESIEEYTEENGTVRIIDAYINSLDLEELGLTASSLKKQAAPRMIQKAYYNYIYTDI